MVQKVAFKARKTPSSPHPATPPEVPLSIESFYFSVDPDVLSQATAGFHQNVVTSQILYKPGLLAAARVIFEGTRWKLYHERDTTRIINFPHVSEFPDWDQDQIVHWDNSRSRSNSEGVSFYMVDSTFDFSAKRFDELQEEFIRYLISNEILELDYNPNLKIHRKMDEEQTQFYTRCIEKLRESHSQEYQTLLDTLERQENRLKERLEREAREHDNALSAGNDEPSGGLDTNRREMDAQATIVDMEDIRRELADIHKSRESKLKEFEDNLDTLAQQIEKDILRLNHSNIKILRFSLVWLPFTEFIIQENETRRVEIIKSF